MSIKSPVVRTWQEASVSPENAAGLPLANPQTTSAPAPLPHAEQLERDIEVRLRAEGLDPYRWSNAPGDVYPAHTHPYHKVLYVVRGSITFAFPATGHQVTLHPGDRLDLPPNTAHEAEVGPGGVVCLEAHRA